MAIVKTSVLILLLKALLNLANVQNVYGVSNSPLQGFFPPVFTPVDSRGCLNLAVIPTYAKFLKYNGINGVLIAGTNGEGLTLTFSERKQLLNAWLVEARALGMHVILQVGDQVFPEVLELARYAASLAADDILTLLTLPEIYYSPTNLERLVYYFGKVAKAGYPLSLMYYDIPIATGVNLNMAEFFKEATGRVPNFAGLKTSLQTALEVTASNVLNKNQTILVATTEGVAAAFENGLNGTITGPVSIFPDLAVAIREAVLDGDLETAKILQLKLSRTVASINSVFEVNTGELSGNIAAQKAAMEMVTGIPMGPTRDPIVHATLKQRKDIARILKASGIRFD